MNAVQSNKPRGMFLLEAVAGVLILVSAMITMTVVFHGSANYFNKVEQVNQASSIARDEIVQLRNQALTSGGFQTLLSGSSATKSVGDFLVETEIQAEPIDSPCRSLESPFGAAARRLRSSAVKVTVSVQWPGSNPSIEPTFETVISEPAREPGAVGITSGAPLEFEAILEDTGGNPIEDVGFEWQVINGPGQGRFQAVDRLGQRSIFQRTAPGNVVIEASTYYRGEKQRATRNVP